MPVDYRQCDDGLRALIRECRAADAAELIDGLGSLSTESRIARFFYDKESFQPDELARLTSPSDRDHLIRVAVVAGRDREERIVGLARCLRLAGTATADLGIVILDGFRRSGFGTQLLLVLRDAARRAGITHWRADFFTGNLGVEKLLRRVGCEEQREDLGAGIVRVTVRLG